MPRHSKPKSTTTAAELGPGSRAIAYVRDSGGSEQELSATQQRQQVEAFCAARGWQIVGWYVDSKSGKSADNRPQFLKMIEDTSVKPRPCDVIVVWALSRLGRNADDRAFFIGGLRRLGIQVISTTEQIAVELRGVHEAVLAMADEAYLKRLSLDVRRAHTDMIHSGLSHGGTPPAGYMREPVERSTYRDGKPRVASRWVPDPDKAPLVIKAFAMRVAGHTLQEIHAATRLHTSDVGYQFMFSNPAYRGTLSYGPAVQIPNAFPALIDEDTWQRAQAKPLPPRAQAGAYLLSGIARCGVCGNGLVGARAQYRTAAGSITTYLYYRCHPAKLSRCPARQIRCEVLDTLVLDHVFATLTPDSIMAAVREAQAYLDSDAAHDERERLQHDVDAARQAVASLRTAVERGSTQALDWLTQREGELRQAESALAGYQRQTERLFVGEADVLAVVATLRDGLSSTDARERKRTLAQIVARVTVVDGVIDVTYRQMF